MPLNDWELHPDRGFDPDPAQRSIARQVYEGIAGLPILSPHGHVDPRLFSDETASFGSPADLLIIPDHYILRMLYSQCIPMEAMGVEPIAGRGLPVERDHRKIWQLFADNYHLFRGTPSGLWLAHELQIVLGVTEALTPSSAMRIYDQVAEKLASPEFTPRRLFERFNIEVLATTDAAADPLAAHQAVRTSGWKGRVIPSFRPDALTHLDTPGWQDNVSQLSAISGVDIHDYAGFLQALEDRRQYFKSMGAVASDHAITEPKTVFLDPHPADVIFQKALLNQATQADAAAFSGHMLIEMARMSTQDGLVMQIHPGSYRNHNPLIFERFGRDKGADIPIPVEFTRGLLPLLERFGNHPDLSLILFTLDETTYSRELAPLAGHYPTVKLGPPWWFNDSLNGMHRYFDQVIETAGLYNTAGFNDDTRAFPSIPARHDLWRRAAANWLAGLVVRHLVSLNDANEMALDLAYRLAKRAYRLE